MADKSEASYYTGIRPYFWEPIQNPHTSIMLKHSNGRRYTIRLAEDGGLEIDVGWSPFALELGGRGYEHPNHFRIKP